MFSRLEHQLPTFLPLGAGLLIIGLVTTLGGLWNYQNELNDHLAAAPSQPVIALTAQKDAAGNKNHASKTGSGKDGLSGLAVNGGSAIGAPAGQTGRDLPSAVTGGGSSRRVSNDSSASDKPVSIISVSLSVNGQAQGRVRVAAGSSQCDVLSQALSQGAIRSLDMRYSSQWGTEGVYVINGMGDPDVVWWTYTVNGSAPPYGCGYVTAHQDDSINWRYIKG